jgi:hypothetical protein
MGLALVSCLLAWLLRARLATMRSGPTVPTLLCALALLVAAGAAISGVEVGRGNLAEQLVAREGPEVAADIVARGIARQLVCLALLGPIALVSLLSAVLLRRASRSPAVWSSRTAVALGTALVLPMIVGTLGTSIYGLWVHAGYVAITYVDPPSKEAAMFDRLQHAYHMLRLMRASIVVSAGAGLGLAILWARSAATRPPSRARIAMAGAVFAAGLGAFISARVHAADRTPLPILTSNQRNSFGIVYAQEMPRFSGCLPPSGGAPVLEFSPNEVLFDRGQVSPGELSDKLATQRRLFPLLHPGVPLPAAALLVLADVATPTDRVIPYLERAGEIEIFIVGSNPRPFASRTLGIIDRWEFCLRAFSLRQDGVPLSSYRTWRDLSLAVERSAAVLGIAAR